MRIGAFIVSWIILLVSPIAVAKDKVPQRVVLKFNMPVCFTAKDAAGLGAFAFGPSAQTAIIINLHRAYDEGRCIVLEKDYCFDVLETYGFGSIPFPAILKIKRPDMSDTFYFNSYLFGQDGAIPVGACKK